MRLSLSAHMRTTLRSRRPLLALVLFVVVGGGAAVARGSASLDPDDVAAEIHNDVSRDVLSRTRDFSATVGPLDCVEVRPRAGSCLANLTSNAHRTDHLMVAVAYEVGPDEQLTWSVRLP
jgi:hypothetical protein